MTKTNKAINYGAALETMTAREKVIELSHEIIKGNSILFELLNQMTPEDYNYYLPKVLAIITKASNRQEPIADQAPTLLLYEQLNWEDDIPDELFCKPNLHP